MGVVRLILASASPRRAELLRTAGFEFEIVAVSVDETVRDGESPAAYVRRLAADKSFVASGFSRAIDGPPGGGHHIQDDVRDDAPIILGADTTVVIDGEILGKPRDDGDAAAMLRRLSGRRHEVLTGVSLRQAAYEVGRVETSAVYFAPLSTGEMKVKS